MWLLLVACTSQDSGKVDTADTGDSAADSSASTNVCSDTATYDTWADGFTRAGDYGTLTFAVSAATAPDKGDNVWTIALSSASDASAVPGETVTIAPYMPEHGHGTNPATVNSTDNGDGTYTSDSFNIFMGGFWQFTLNATGAAGSDTTVLNLCIQG